MSRKQNLLYNRAVKLLLFASSSFHSLHFLLGDVGLPYELHVSCLFIALQLRVYSHWLEWHLPRCLLLVVAGGLVWFECRVFIDNQVTLHLSWGLAALIGLSGILHKPLTLGECLEFNGRLYEIAAASSITLCAVMAYLRFGEHISSTLHHYFF